MTISEYDFNSDFEMPAPPSSEYDMNPTFDMMTGGMANTAVPYTASIAPVGSDVAGLINITGGIPLVISPLPTVNVPKSPTIAPALPSNSIPIITGIINLNNAAGAAIKDIGQKLLNANNTAGAEIRSLIPAVSNQMLILAIIMMSQNRRTR